MVVNDFVFRIVCHWNTDWLNNSNKRAVINIDLSFIYVFIILFSIVHNTLMSVCVCVCEHVRGPAVIPVDCMQFLQVSVWL